MGPRERQGPKRKRIDRAEDRGVRPDAERQNGQRSNRETWRARETFEAIADVERQPVIHGEPLPVVMRFRRPGCEPRAGEVAPLGGRRHADVSDGTTPEPGHCHRRRTVRDEPPSSRFAELEYFPPVLTPEAWRTRAQQNPEQVHHDWACAGRTPRLRARRDSRS